ncbi:hypothetical protein [Aureimonas mangrovi]|uniref:hypothetical protein n=1 Tax=Aureimonas mangrovi TaxID=2758041 RepID=UPI00163DC73B|nr:hypothetical protein [Aureimonas mangrovi]
MSVRSRIVPVVVAGVVGIGIGWLLAPDISAVRDDFAARFNEQTPLIQGLQTSVADIQARMGAMPDAQAIEAAIQAQLAASEERITTLVNDEGRSQPITDGLEDVRGRLDAISQEVTGLREDMAASAQAQSEAAAQPAEDEAGRLASEIGATGAVLLPGQGAIFGGNRIDLTELDAEGGTATMTPEGGEATNVAEGDTVQLSETCTVRLAGIASGAAYLAPEECTETAATQEAAPEGQAQQPGSGAPASPTQDNQAPAAGAAQDQQSGTQTPAEGAQAVPDQQPGQAQENAPNAGQPQGGGQPAQ